MSREEAAADAVYGQNYGWQFNMTEAEGVAEAALAAADAWDAANGVHRVSLDDATVEKAAQALLDAFYNDETLKVDDEDRDIVRKILAAAVKEGQ